jgi:seryl-tRNA synthetase
MLAAACAVGRVRAFGVASRPASRIVTSQFHSTSTDTETDITMVHGRIANKDNHLSLDTRTIANHLDLVLSHLQARRASDETKQAATTISSLQQERVALIQERDGHLNARKEASALVGKLMRDKDTDNTEAVAEAKETSSQAAEAAAQAEEKLSALETTVNDLLGTIPNLLDDLVPDGDDEDDNEEVYVWGNVEDLPNELEWPESFEPKWHDDVASTLNGYQAEAAVKMSGARFVALSGVIAQLERALASFFMDMHTSDHGYTEMSVPLVVGSSSLEGTGQLPKFKEDLFAITPESHTCNGEDAYLIPTAEVPLTNLHRDSVLEEADLPLSYVAWTPCFRAEAGSYGRDTRGLIRTHQFGKVELVKITTPETSNEEHESLTLNAEACLQKLKLPYRKVRLCSGDVGFSARHCYDLEVWLPGAQEFREISSCSNTGDFQAQRMALRYRPNPPPADGKKKKAKKPKPQLCHTINGSGLAIGRALVAVLENYQMPDGSVVIPEVLRPYMGNKEVLKPN